MNKNYRITHLHRKEQPYLVSEFKGVDATGKKEIWQVVQSFNSKKEAKKYIKINKIDGTF